MESNETTAPVIWLRQSARFQVGEQRRTVAIAIPVRPGASAAEIERLLGQADAGMEALTRHLDGRIAALLAGAPTQGNGAHVATPDVTPSAATSGASLPARPPAPVPTAPTPPTRPTAPPAPSSVSAPAPAPATAIAERPAAGARPVPPRSTPGAAATPTPPPARPAAAPAPAPATAPATSGPLSRPEFLAETRTLGLTPQQVMQRLQVRSLDGLDYREALDLLRRQLLDDAGATAAPAASPPTSAPNRAATPPSTAAAAPVAPAPAAAPRTEPGAYRFEEEDDDYDFTISLADGADSGEDGDTYADAMDGMADGASDGLMDELDDLPEVPDLDEASPPAPAARRPAPSATRATREPAASEPATQQAPARGRELLDHFRGITPGGAATPDQIKAYTNLIVSQLDATQAGTLVRGMWGAAPNRLGFDQLYALIQWGKEDAFAEEAPAVLAAIKAEATSKSGASHDAAPPARPTRPARAPRADGGGDA